MHQEQEVEELRQTISATKEKYKIAKAAKKRLEEVRSTL